MYKPLGTTVEQLSANVKSVTTVSSGFLSLVLWNFLIIFQHLTVNENERKFARPREKSYSIV